MTYLPGSALPPAASDRAEFSSQIHANPSTELALVGLGETAAGQA